MKSKTADGAKQHSIGGISAASNNGLQKRFISRYKRAMYRNLLSNATFARHNPQYSRE